MRNENLYAALRAAFPADLSQVAVETADGAPLFYSWADLEHGSARIANLLDSLSLPPASRIAVQTDKSVEALLLYLAVLRAGHVFLPPVSIILMTAPILLPPLKAAGFDLIWFGILMTIVMEMGLIHPPVGLNIFVIKNIAPDIPLSDVIWGVLPFVLLMMVAVLLICIFPGIAMWLPTVAMG